LSGSTSGSTSGSSQAKGSLGNAAASRGLSSELVTTGVALGATLLVIVLARSAVKRFGGGGAAGKRPSGVVEVLARYPLARGQSIVLIKVARRVIVAHQSSDGMKPLSEFSSEEDVADLLARCEAGARGTSQFSFDALLRQSGKAFDGFGSSAKDRAGKADERIDPRDTLPAVMRGAEIETVDLTRPRKGGAR
jgi:flagellar biogenesis protein FliO